MGKWFPTVYDWAMNPFEKGRFEEIRRELIHKVYGKVLEIGAGSGINFPFYRDVEGVDAIEPNPAMVAKSNRRSELAVVPIHIHEQKAENLSFDDDTFDTVIATLVFCTIPNPVQALEEIKRVCKPGGKVLFFEHVKMEQPNLAHLQDWLNPFWKRICDGCHLNRETLELVKESGIEVVSVSSYYKGLFLTVECVNH
ncbi:class I SAM-dependent methyltransferase [Robertmurraya andreesenii]|uniref:Ubiquinone/menaquinone biosynthesis C-methylase UbiE n=1 Tax=Anoxybacillus andreesenii TaxID=1325932 RepID=A0ABT9V7P1_9BACL|nr:class I SAM-dependent methyltransferase [Robertmurraya andreesenii]MDQ0156949.1 ubiquinone/menaquinone biosynthesis C-methylase UbiE [Robertmurraya andreesenii]